MFYLDTFCKKIHLINGDANEILKKERVILNLIQRMSGIATETNKYVVKATPQNIKILDTRKTRTPAIGKSNKPSCGA